MQIIHQFNANGPLLLTSTSVLLNHHTEIDGALEDNAENLELQLGIFSIHAHCCTRVDPDRCGLHRAHENGGLLIINHQKKDEKERQWLATTQEQGRRENPETYELDAKIKGEIGSHSAASRLQTTVFLFCFCKREQTIQV